MRNKSLYKIIASVLTAAMLFTSVNVGAFAEEASLVEIVDAELEMTEDLEDTVEEDDKKHNEDIKEISEISIIENFEEFDIIQNSLHVDRDTYPTTKELVSIMPEQLGVYINNELVKVNVGWECVGDDYETKKGYYYQFSPVFSDEYILDDTIDVRDVPYIAVFVIADDVIEYGEQISPVMVTSNANEKKVYNFLTTTMGLNNAAACGIMANIQYESGFRTDVYGDNGTSYGLCQWHNSRFTNLKNYCSQHGLDYTSVEGQMNFLWYELRNSYSGVWKHMLNVSNTADGAYDAGYYWCYNFEIPANRGTVSVTRGNAAKNSYWPEYGQSAVATPDAPVVKSAKYFDINRTEGTYSIEAEVYAPGGISRVQFLTWTPVNDQDDIQPEWWTNPIASGSVTDLGNFNYKAVYKVNIADHGNERGNYVTHVYAYDNYGQQGVIALDLLNMDKSYIPELVSGDVYDVDLKNGSYKVKVIVKTDGVIDRVQFPTWTVTDDQDDIQPAWWTNPIASGSLKDLGGGQYESIYNVDIKDHGNARDNYLTHVYAYNTDGEGICVLAINQELYYNPVESISFDLSNITLKVNEEKEVSISVYPSNASIKDYILSSEDEKIVSINQETKTIKGLSKGETNIIAKSVDGDFEAKCKVIVNDTTIDNPDDSNELIYKGGIIIAAKQKYDISRIINIPGVKYKVFSVDGGKATISKKGILKASKPGSVKIVPYVKQGKTKAYKEDAAVTVKIVKPMFNSSVMVATSLNQSIKFNDLITGIEGQNVTWEVKNPSNPVVSVNYEKGEVVTLRKGKVKIIAYVKNSQGYTVKLSKKLTVKPLYNNNPPSIDYSKFIGLWQDKVSERATMDIFSSSDGYVQINITWGVSASETDYWCFYAKLDPSDPDRLTYAGGASAHGIVYPDGTEEEITTASELEGYFYLDSAGLMHWVDITTGDGINCLFEKVR